MKISKTTAPRILEQMRAAGILDSVRTFNSGGKGGQHGNRSFNAIHIRATWNFDGEPRTFEATASLKSQLDSRAAALRILFSRRNQAIEEARRAVKASHRVVGAGFGGEGRVRSYHQPKDRVSDTSGFSATWRETLGKGDLGTLIERRRDHKISG